MVNIVIELVDLDNQLNNNCTIQVNKSFTPDDLQNYLNIITNSKNIYTFYIEKEILRTSLESFLEKYSINYETKIIIEFEINKNKFDLEIDAKSHISFLEVCKESNRLVIGCYTDSLKFIDGDTLKCTNNLKCTNDTLKCTNDTLKCTDDTQKCTEAILFASDKNNQVVFTRSNEVVNCKTFEISHVAKITALFVKDDRVYYGLRNGKCYELREQPRFIGESEGYKIVGIQYYKNTVTFFAINGVFIKDDLNNTMEKKKCNITAVDLLDDILYVGTSNGEVYKIEDSKETKYSVDLQFISHIKVIDDNFVLIGGQYKVLLLQMCPFRYVNEFTFEQEISGMQLHNKCVYISAGTKVYRVKGKY